MLKQTKILLRDSSSIGPQIWIISDIFCIYFTAPMLPYCVFVCGFSRLQPQCLGHDWFKYHPISLTCTDRAARANYIHLVMWLGFQVVNILWQHGPPAAAATHQCSYIIPQLRTQDQKHPPEYTLLGHDNISMKNGWWKSTYRYVTFIKTDYYQLNTKP